MPSELGVSNIKRAAIIQHIMEYLYSNDVKMSQKEVLAMVKAIEDVRKCHYENIAKEEFFQKLLNSQE